jgi:hypothetical protein
LSHTDPSEYKPKQAEYEWKATGGIQSIAGKIFTPTKVETFNGKDGKLLCIIETEETFNNIEYKLQDSDEKVKGDVSRFFASPRDIKAYFTDPETIKAINEEKFRPKCMIENVPFDDEAIKRDASLKNKTHYVFQKIGDRA